MRKTKSVSTKNSKKGSQYYEIAKGTKPINRPK